MEPTELLIDRMVAEARAYLADRRMPQPRAHDLCVALVTLADTAEQSLSQIDAELRRGSDALARMKHELGVAES